MLGNHRDGWTYGASDPSSGTSVMTEIVRALGTQLKKGNLLESLNGKKMTEFWTWVIEGPSVAALVGIFFRV